MSRISERNKDVNENIENETVIGVDGHQLKKQSQPRSPIRMNLIQINENVSRETEPDCPGSFAITW